MADDRIAIHTDRHRRKVAAGTVIFERLVGTGGAGRVAAHVQLKILIDGGQKRLNEETVSIYSKKLDELSYLNKL